LYTPAAFLPRIGDISERMNSQPQTGLDTLQEHLHKMLLKNLKQCRQGKNLKSLENQVDKKRLDLKEREEEQRREG
jgi:hypothetical protein